MTGRAALLLACLPALAGAQDRLLPPQMAERLSAIEAECSGLDGGETTVGRYAFRQVDLTGDGTLDWVFNQREVTCSSTTSPPSCGTGGCVVSFQAANTAIDRMAKDWQLVDLRGKRAIILHLHGASCGGINPTPCVEALVWDPASARFTTVASEE